MTSIVTYKQMKRAYEEFKQNLPNDSFTRYYKEIMFMKNLIAIAEKRGLQKDVFEYSAIKDNAVKKLDELGYKFL